MITDKSFAKEWIERLKAQNPKASINPPLLEKMIYALSLSELLQLNGLDFIFKGGTSLILLLDTPQRFSIDIDIITQASQETIETVLDLKDFMIQEPDYNFLNKKVKFANNALFYWREAVGVLKSGS